MSISSALARLSSLHRRKPLIVNALIYGSLYTTAEFLQQSWSKKYISNSPDEIRKSAIIAETPESCWPIELVQKFNKVLGLDQDAATIQGDYNWAQLKRFAIYGCFLAGPIQHGWYRWLDGVYSGISKQIILRKLLMDQFVLTPALLAFFFVNMNLMEGKSDVLAECKAKFATTFGIACIYWIPVQTLNFMVIPPAFRVTYVGLATLCWANILCYVKRQPAVKDEECEAK